MKVEFFYDIVCPYAYLGSTQIRRVAEGAGAEVVYKPFLLGGVFRAIGAVDDPNASMPAAKLRHNLLDMHRWASWWKVPLRLPEAHPRRTVLALRAILAAGPEDRVRATDALFRAYWVEGRDVSDPEAVAATLREAGLDGARIVEAAEDPAIKAELFRCTEEAVERGVFGAPAFFVDDELYWGQDQLPFVAEALTRGASDS